MNDNITIPRWLFDELCERAQPGPVQFKLTCSCLECGVAEGELHRAGCSYRKVGVDEPKFSYQEVLDKALSS